MEGRRIVITVTEVEERVADIADLVDDDESAHSAEDDLHRAVLAAIADGAENPAALAAAALKTVGLDFARWCAG